ncbi:zinc finger protein ZFPM2-like, partial [Salvelinus fontinalis]|uniref:zinc finger protein ZFPM2-like n=1 Tax=Salvelinus fontinalis TaxID=8038 RepID=UPI0024853246
PLEDGTLGEEEECVSEENELMAKDEFSTEENFSAEFESENMSCEDMEYYCNKGEEDGSGEAGESDMDGQSEKTRHPAIGPEDWDGPRELDAFHKDGERRIHSRQQLPVGTTWGPFNGKIEMNIDGSGMVGHAFNVCLFLSLILSESHCYWGCSGNMKKTENTIKLSVTHFPKTLVHNLTFTLLKKFVFLVHQSSVVLRGLARQATSKFLPPIQYSESEWVGVKPSQLEGGGNQFP